MPKDHLRASTAATNCYVESRRAGLAPRSRRRAWQQSVGVPPRLLTACLWLLPATPAGREPQLIQDNALGAHSMLYFDTPEAGDDAVFAQAQGRTRQQRPTRHVHASIA